MPEIPRLDSFVNAKRKALHAPPAPTSSSPASASTSADTKAGRPPESLSAGGRRTKAGTTERTNAGAMTRATAGAVVVRTTVSLPVRVASLLRDGAARRRISQADMISLALAQWAARDAPAPGESASTPAAGEFTLMKPTVDDEPRTIVALRLLPQNVELMDRLQQERGLPSRSEMIRRALEAYDVD